MSSSLYESDKLSEPDSVGVQEVNCAGVSFVTVELVSSWKLGHETYAKQGPIIAETSVESEPG